MPKRRAPETKNRSRSRQPVTRSKTKPKDFVRILSQQEQQHFKQNVVDVRRGLRQPMQDENDSEDLSDMIKQQLDDYEFFSEDVSTSVSKPAKLHQDQYRKALESLHETSLPSQIPCRDSEKAEIEHFLRQGLENCGQSQALYISGVPGIGKTASFLEVKSRLEAEHQKFKFVHLNGMNLSAPESLYCELLSELTGIDKVSKKQACLILTELFSKGKLPAQFKMYENEATRGNKIVLLDECDYLLTPNQQLLYNLVDWPSQPRSKLTIVMIANTMDFPERLKPKLQSRLGNHRIVYKPYSSAQIEEIVAQRLKQSGSLELFQPDALMFVAKKVATVSTDIRKTLEICRNAIEQASDEVRSRKVVKVSIDHVKQAYNNVYSQPYHECLPFLSERVKLLLVSIALEAHYKGYNIAYLSNVCERFNQLQSVVLGINVRSNQTQLEMMVQQLKQVNVIDTKEKIWLQGHKEVETKPKEFDFQARVTKQLFNVADVTIQLQITIDDLKNSMKDDAFFQKFSSMF